MSSPSPVTPNADLAMQEFARRSLLGFVKLTFPSYRIGRLQRFLGEELEAFEQGVRDEASPRLMLFLPPRSGKSELASRRFPPWALGRNPDWNIILASYGAELAEELSGDARRTVLSEEFDQTFGQAAALEPGETVELERNRKSVAHWRIAGRQGGLRAVGVGGAVTGRGADILILDDPVKNREDADSKLSRERNWRWYTSTARTRLEPGGGILVLCCMTGDTLVRMADSTERPLRDIRPGDRIATYQGGILATSAVVNHASQGYDDVYRITMTSGTIVHANKRHPFLVAEQGHYRWIRLRDLTTGHRIVAVRDSGASGAASSAQPKNATSLSPVEGSAVLTMPGRSGPMAIGAHPPTLSIGASPTSNIGTGSPSLSTTRSLPLKAASAPSASNPLPTGTLAPISAANSVSITITPPVPCEGCSAPTATSLWGMPDRQQPPSQWLTTSDFTTDQIASIEPAGVAEVFDVQIAGTENYIANGLVSHNTRWHWEDLPGRILAEAELDPSADQWRVVSLPALAGEQDPLGRAPGEPLDPERFDASALIRTRATIGARDWAALYDQSPSPDEGAILRTGLLMQEEDTHAPGPVYQFWDTAFSKRQEADRSACTTWRLERGAYRLLHACAGRWSLSELRQIAVQLYAQFRPRAVVVEAMSSGPSLIQSMLNWRLPTIAWRPDADKVARAHAITPLLEAGLVRIPMRAGWLEDFLEELRRFPTGEHDDYVDSFTMALTYMGVRGKEANNTPRQIPFRIVPDLSPPPTLEPAWLPRALVG